MIIPSQITSGNLPVNFTGTFAEYYAAIRDRLRGFIPDDKVIVGYTGTTVSNVDLGPWLRQDSEFAGPNPPVEWWSWINGRYIPAPKRIGNQNFYVELEASPTVDRTQVLQGEQSGTVALLYDVYVPVPTIVLSGATPEIDWTLSNNFIHRLTSDAVYTMRRPAEGKTVTIAIQNNGTAYTGTFGAGIKWPGGSYPGVPVGSTGKNAVGIFEFHRINNQTYGDRLLSSVASPSPQVDIDPGETAGPHYGPPARPIPEHNLP